MEKKKKNELQVFLGCSNSVDKEIVKERLKKFIDENKSIRSWMIVDEGLREGGHYSQ